MNILMSFSKSLENEHEGHGEVILLSGDRLTWTRVRIMIVFFSQRVTHKPRVSPLESCLYCAFPPSHNYIFSCLSLLHTSTTSLGGSLTCVLRARCARWHIHWRSVYPIPSVPLVLPSPHGFVIIFVGRVSSLSCPEYSCPVHLLFIALFVSQTIYVYDRMSSLSQRVSILFAFHYPIDSYESVAPLSLFLSCLS